MVFEVEYSTNRDKLRGDIEKKRVEERFNSLSDYLIPKDELENYRNKNSNLKVIGGKNYELKVKENISNIIRKVIDTKSF